MSRRSGKGRIRDVSGSRTGCSYVISFHEELERLAAVSGGTGQGTQSTEVSGLVMTLESPGALNFAATLILELEDGREVLIEAPLQHERLDKPLRSQARDDVG